MQSSVIGKVEKAKLYASEPHRMSFNDFTVAIKGDNNTHTVTYKQGEWACGCSFFDTWNWCCHTLAMQKILGVMLPEEAHQPEIEPV